MPNDAKLGLVLGVGIVIVLGVIYHRAEQSSARPRPEAAAASTGEPGGPFRLTGSGTARDDGPAIPEQPAEEGAR